MCVCVCVCVCACAERGSREGGRRVKNQTTTTQISYSKPSIKTENNGAVAVYTHRLSLLSDCTGDGLLYTQVLAYFIHRC